MKKAIQHTITPWPESRSFYGWDTPISKLPDCPLCENDELSMLNSDQIFCNACHVYFKPLENDNAKQ